MGGQETLLMFYVYTYKDPQRNEIIYVGKGNDRYNKVSHRHLRRNDKHPFTQRLQKMARENVKPIIQRIENINEDESFELERLLIKVLGRKNLKTGSLLNLTDGGEGPSGIQHTEEFKKARRNHKHSIETRLKTSNNHFFKRNGRPGHGDLLREFYKTYPEKSSKGKTWYKDSITGKRVWVEKHVI
jgi:hypothetical protein